MASEFERDNLRQNVKGVTIQIFASRGAAELARAKLEAHGIKCWVEADDCGGMYPNLAMSGGVRLFVPAADSDTANALLKEEAPTSELALLEAAALAAPPPAEETSKVRIAPIQIIFALLAGIILCLVCQQIEKPATRTNYVYTQDRRCIEAWVYRNNYLVEMTKDRNLDGKWDEWVYYNRGWVARMEMDNNFDGKPDEWITYSNSIPISAEKDTDFNGIPDEFCTYKNGIVEQIDVKPNGSTFSDQRWIYQNGVLSEIQRGGDSNGHFSLVTHYDSFFNPTNKVSTVSEESPFQLLTPLK